MRSFGEWIGFLGGVFVFVVLVIVVVLVATANHVTIRVQNDTGTFVRVSGCVDDAANVEQGEDFDAEGIPEHNQLVCRVTPSQGPERCVAVKVPRSGGETALLSRLRAVRSSSCD